MLADVYPYQYIQEHYHHLKLPEFIKATAKHEQDDGVRELADAVIEFMKARGQNQPDRTVGDVLDENYRDCYDSPADFAERYYLGKLLIDEPPDDVPEYIWLALKAVDFNRLADILCEPDNNFFYYKGHVFKEDEL